MHLSDLRDRYWMKEQLVALAGRLGLPTHGWKPELFARIERRLKDLPDAVDTKPRPARSAPRDSDKTLRRSTPVVNYKSDAKTRAFFEKEIGSPATASTTVTSATSSRTRRTNMLSRPGSAPSACVAIAAISVTPSRCLLGVVHVDRPLTRALGLTRP